MYGLEGRNFLLTLQRLARERDELKIVDDQIGSPTWCRTISQITLNILTQILPPDSPANLTLFEQSSGLYNLVCSGETSWFGFAKAILEGSSPAPATRLTPIPTSDYPTPPPPPPPTPAPRPKNSVLSTEKLRAAFGIIPPPWEATLQYCLSLQSPPATGPGK